MSVFSGMLKKEILQPSKRIHYDICLINIRRSVYAFPEEGPVLVSTHSLPFPKYSPSVLMSSICARMYTGFDVREKMCYLSFWL